MKHIPGNGPRDARLVIVGEAPGAHEETQGQPFVGPAGKLLRDFLMKAGINPNQVYYTNICKYRPPANKLRTFFSKEGYPNELVIEGMAELQRELLEIRPNLVLACGAYAMWALTGIGKWDRDEEDGGYKGVFGWRGSVVPCSMVEGLKVLITLHPSYINREGYKDHGTFLFDLGRAKEQMAFPEIRSPEKKIIIDPSLHEREEWLEEAKADFHNYLTLDIEYVGSKLVCVGMTTHRDKAVCIPTRTAADVRFVQSVLESGMPLCAQNGMFDCAILEWHYRMNVMQHLKYDTMLAMHASRIELPKDLGYLCSIYTDQPTYWLQKDGSPLINWNNVKKGKQAFSDVFPYNATDTWVTHQVMEEQLQDDLTDPAVREVFEFEMQLVQALWPMSKRGVRVDFEKLKSLDSQLLFELLELNLELTERAGGEMNVKSGPAVSKFLFEQLGLTPLKLNKTGPATDDKTLAELIVKATTEEQRRGVQLIRDIRSRRSLREKFTLIEFDDDGRARGHYNPGGTVTGRLACRKFFPTGKGYNQQNVPRDKRVRSVHLPDKGKLFGYADLERAESLVVAYLTMDPEMLRVHQPGVNAHKELGARLFDCKPEDIEKDSPEYYLGKKTRHAGNYMQGPITFMRNVNQESAKSGVEINFQEAKRFIQIYRDLHEYLQAWWDRTEDEIKSTRTLQNLLGRPRFFFDRIGSCLPEAVAYKPQSTVGDVLNVGLLALSGLACQYAQRRGMLEAIRAAQPVLRDCGFELLMNVHDAVAFQFDQDKGEVVLPIVEQLMSVPLTNPRTGEDFIIPIEIAVGEDWGNVKTWVNKAKA